MVTGIALCVVPLAAGASTGAAPLPPHTRAATQSCLLSHANAVAGLPPATPPARPSLFVYALAHDDLSTSFSVGVRRPRAHTQLGVWLGNREYQGIILSFFRSVPDARASLKSLGWLYGGRLSRNVVATWDQKPIPSRSMRRTVFRCLRSNGSAGAKRPAPPAFITTFAGRWGGHTRGLSITLSGRGHESANDGCCSRVYQMTFKITSVSGTLTRAAAEYRVTSFRRSDRGFRSLHVGEIGKLLLRNGIVTNTLTHDFFCSGPAWGATAACGA